MCKEKLLRDIDEISKIYIGPFFCGNFLTIGDIDIAPYMMRMCVLKYYRNFEVPKSFIQWHDWKTHILRHSAVQKTMVSEDHMTGFYMNYADHSIRNLHYHRYFGNGPNWLKEDLKKEKEE
jgi:hypothetical protein